MRVLGIFGDDSISVINNALDVFVKVTEELERGIAIASKDKLEILDKIGNLEVKNQEISRAQDRAYNIITKIKAMIE